MLAIVFLAFFYSLTCWAQPFSFGVKAGVPLTDLVRSQSAPFGSSTTNRYIIGGDFELHLPLRFAVEFDVLYRHLKYTDSVVTPLGGTTERVTTGLWEFPLLLKYRFPGKVARPYVDAGPSFETLTGIHNSFTEFLSIPSSESQDMQTGDMQTGHANRDNMQTGTA